MTKYSKEICIELAHRCKTTAEFRKRYASAYVRAWSLGILPLCYMGLETARKRWTKEECHAEALKYKSRYEFLVNSHRVYMFASKHGWIQDICKHMKAYEHRH